MNIGHTTKKEYLRRLQGVLHYVELHLDEDLSLQRLSKISCFSQFHFHRIFSAFIGETPTGFVNRIRIEKSAMYLIMNPKEAITDIAYRVGFSSPAAYTRAFKKHFDANPTEWRENYLANIENSKIGKVDSKNWKQSLQLDEYVSDVNNESLNSNQERLTMEIQYKDEPAMRIAYLVHHEGYNEKIGEIWKKLCNWAGPRGLLHPGTKYIGIGLDDPKITPPDKCRYYACITIPDDFKDTNDVNVMELKAGRRIVGHFEITGDQIGDAYQQMYMNVLPESGMEPDDVPGYEVYLNDPDKDGKFIMDIHIPVKTA